MTHEQAATFVYRHMNEQPARKMLQLGDLGAGRQSQEGRWAKVMRRRCTEAEVS